MKLCANAPRTDCEETIMQTLPTSLEETQIKTHVNNTLLEIWRTECQYQYVVYYKMSIFLLGKL